MTVKDLIKELEVRSEQAIDKHTRLAFAVAARYLQALLDAGEFSDTPRYFRPGAHWEEF